MHPRVAYGPSSQLLAHINTVKKCTVIHYKASINQEYLLDKIVLNSCSKSGKVSYARDNSKMHPHVWLMGLLARPVSRLKETIGQQYRATSDESY